MAGVSQDIHDLFGEAVRHYRAGRLHEAISLLQMALDQKPDAVPVLGAYAQTLLAAERYEAAADMAMRLARAVPGDAGAWMLRGVAFFCLGRAGDAADSFSRAIFLRPDMTEAYFRRAAAHRADGHIDLAIADFDAVLAVNPTLVEAHVNKGNALLDLGRPEEALRSFDRALVLRPDSTMARNNRGNALLALDRPAEALEDFDRAIAEKPDFFQAYNNRGNARQALKDFAGALEDYDHAVAIHPGYADAMANRGNALQRLMRLEDAIVAYGVVLAKEPAHADALANRAVAFSRLGRDEEALADYHTLINITPGAAQPYYDMAVALLRMERFSEGWPLFEWRRHLPGTFGLRIAHQPFWTGREDIAGKTLLVDAEQGFGDTIQFCRYLPLLLDTGARIVFCVPSRLRRLVAAALPDVMVVAPGDEPAFDYRILLLGLPFALGISGPDGGSPVPYLGVERERAAHWKARLPAGGFKIGLSWQGNKDSPADAGRSFPARYFRVLADIPGICFISLQKGEAAKQLQDLRPGMDVKDFGEDLDSGPDAFIDTAAIMGSLDLVITSDTAIAHLAGALGRPVWLVLQHHPDWRWFRRRTDSPWYPTMTLFRQRAPGDWEGVFAGIRQRLLELLCGHS